MVRRRKYGMEQRLLAVSKCLNAFEKVINMNAVGSILRWDAFNEHTDSRWLVLTQDNGTTETPPHINIPKPEPRDKRFRCLVFGCRHRAIFHNTKEIILC